MNRAQIKTTLKEIIAKRINGVKAESIGADDDLAKLGADSLAFSWIMADMENAFGFAMRLSDLIALRTLSASVDFVEVKMKQA